MAFNPEFDQDKCTRCGECFHRCPVLELPLAEAKAEIERLIAGKPGGPVLDKCESCFTCDYVCPENARPASLILRRWNEAYEREGLPRRAMYFMPHSVPNFRTFAIDRLPEDEKTMLRSWMDTSPAEEIFYPGCNWITAPYLAKTKILEGVTIRGALAYCCGEMYFRMGLYQRMRELAARLNRWLEKMGTRRMLIPCTAGMNLFRNVLPGFGLTVELEIEHMLPWLLRRIDAGEIELSKKLDMRVTVQESCHAKVFGEEFMALPRELLSRLGCEVVEEDHHGERMFCCGIGGGFSHPSSYHPLRLTTSTWRNLAEAKKTGAEAVVAYCAGCSQMLATGRITNPANRMPVHHLLELVRMAMGEEVLPRSEKLKRAAWFLAGVTRHQGPALFMPGRFSLPGLPEEEDVKY